MSNFIKPCNEGSNVVKFYTAVERHYDDILYVGYNDNQREIKRIKFKPTLFIASPEPTKYTTLNGLYVDTFQPGYMSECSEFIKTHEASNFKIYGNLDYSAQFIAETFPNGCKPDASVMNITFVDIEVESDQGFPNPEEAKLKITAITVKNNLNDTFYTWGYGDFDVSKSTIKDKRIQYTKCNNEEILLTKFIDHWSKNTPDIISGWYSNEFDIIYIINRITKVLGKEATRKLSLFKLYPEKNKKDNTYTIPGSTQLDFMSVFKKLGYTYGNQDSYKLDNVANVILGEKKIDYSEYSSLHMLYKENHQKFIDYNIRDVSLVERMEDKTGLLSLALTLAHKANSTYKNIFGSVRIWDTFIYNILNRKNVIIQGHNPEYARNNLDGGYVKDPIIGMHKWVCSFDLNSLYPHLIMQYNMSPETIVNDTVESVSVDNLLNNTHYDIPKEMSMSATGQLFKNDRKGLFPTIVENMYAERTEIKKKALSAKQKLETIDKKDVREKFLVEKEISRYDNEQMAIKIMMNSLYGAISNIYFRYYDWRIASSITISGQLAIRWAEQVINKYMNSILKTKGIDYVIAIDTDSLYVKLDDLVNQVMPNETDNNKICAFIDRVAGQKIEPILNDAYGKLQKYLNAFSQKMSMKREIIASKVIFTGKKRYITNVLNNEGVQYTKPKIKITGIEAVQSSTPQICRKFIENTIDVIINQDETTVQEFIQKTREEFNKLSPEDIAFPRGVSEINKNYAQGVGIPIHVRASRLYNKLILDKKLVNKYEEIKDGSKIKFSYLKMPNPMGQNVIAFMNVLPTEFNIKEYIDYDTQFNKTYVEPIKHILDSLGWKIEKINTLENFF